MTSFSEDNLWMTFFEISGEKNSCIIHKIILIDSVFKSGFLKSIILKKIVKNLSIRLKKKL